MAAFESSVLEYWQHETNLFTSIHPVTGKDWCVVIFLNDTINSLEDLHSIDKEDEETEIPLNETIQYNTTQHYTTLHNTIRKA